MTYINLHTLLCTLIYLYYYKHVQENLRYIKINLNEFYAISVTIGGITKHQ